MSCFLHNFSLKQIESNGVFEGYANVFNVIDHNRDIVVPGAFGAINHENVKLLWQHDFNKPIGRILTIEENNKGLYVKCALLLEITQGRETYELLKSNIINGMSIGYLPIKYHTRPDGVRVLNKVEVLEVSLVTFPSNQEARVTFVKGNNVSNSEFIEIKNSIANAIRMLTI